MISICICTYNRSRSLQKTLESLSAQIEVDVHAFEVLVVDNNCIDETQLIVEAFRKRMPVRCVTERRQGLAHARNCAMIQSKGDTVLFTDDDVRLHPNWLVSYQDAICRFPQADYFGGRILPDWGDAKPPWIGKRPLALIDGLLCWFDHGDETRPIGTDESPPFGASFAVRRSLFKSIGPFREDLGVGGTGLGRGEETEFLLRAKASGAKGVYVGKALCYHAFDRDRFAFASLWRYGIACGRSHNAIAVQPRRGSYKAAAWFVLKGSFQALKGRGERFRQCIINAGIEAGTRRPVRGGR